MKKSASVVLSLLLSSLFSQSYASADTAGPPEANAELTDTASVQTSSHAPKEGLTRLSALAPPPQLSERALGIHTVSCLPGTAPGFLE